ncbi:MAG: HigA family addiction module antitoxin [Erythrobacter sp.]
MPDSMVAGLAPMHPGELLREDVIPGSGLSKTAFAQRLGISREALHNVLSGKSSVSTILALKLGRLLGTSPEIWLNMQRQYDLATLGPDKLAEIEKVEALDLV